VVVVVAVVVVVMVATTTATATAVRAAVALVRAAVSHRYRPLSRGCWLVSCMAMGGM
jgi:hypothetical protein